MKVCTFNLNPKEQSSDCVHFIFLPKERETLLFALILPTQRKIINKTYLHALSIYPQSTMHFIIIPGELKSCVNSNLSNDSIKVGLFYDYMHSFHDPIDKLSTACTSYLYSKNYTYYFW